MEYIVENEFFEFNAGRELDYIRRRVKRLSPGVYRLFSRLKIKQLIAELRHHRGKRVAVLHVIVLPRAVAGFALA